MRTTIGDIHAGLPDAKDDIILHKQEFMDDFVMPPKFSIRYLVDSDPCFIIGNKGLGKTATLRYLSQYLTMRDSRTKSTFTLFDRGFTHQIRDRMVSMANQDYVTYDIDDTSGLDMRDFSLVWRWHIYLTIIRDNADKTIFAYDGNWKKFSKFVLGALKDSFKVKISGGIDVGIPEEAAGFLPPLFDFFKPHASIEFPEFQIGRKDYTFEEAMAEADSYFIHLKRFVTPYYLFFDEIDVYYGRGDIYQRDLRLAYDLALEVKRLNTIIQSQGWHNTKAFCTLRPEILDAIENRFTSRSLVREMKGLEFPLSWASDAKETYTLPIMSLLMQRIKNAENSNGEAGGNDSERYSRWFPEKIEGLEPSEYITSITWSKPRDIVRLLSEAIKVRGRDKFFSAHVFEDLMREYSAGSLMEIKGELEATFRRADLDAIFDCFLDMPREFEKKDFQESFDEIRPELERDVDVVTVLKDLYRVGAIGQVSQSRERWSYLKDKFSVRLPYIVHKGLVFELGVVEDTRAFSGKETEGDPLTENKSDGIVKNGGGSIPQSNDEEKQEKAPSDTDDHENITGEEAYNIGEDYYYGRNGVAQDNKEAVKWYRLAAEQGNVAAQFDLGFMYANGRGVAQDDKEAVKWYRLAAEQGDADAQSNLGNMYRSGEGVAQDDKEAVKWYRLAAEQGNAAAQCNLGFMYGNGRGVAQDDKEAVKWYRLAAKQGRARAQCNLGIMYANGQGVAQDDKEAVNWYRLAAEKGDADAQSNLGNMYRNGRGVAQDDKEAVKWYRLAAEQGNAAAQCNLGFMYGNGRGVAQDDKEAVKWYRLAAKQGRARAQCNLGIMYANGQGVAQDDKEAVNWYRLAAEKGDADAQSNLGNMYRNGRGVAQDDKEAVKWYRLAAEQGNAAAQCNLGFMYGDGRGVAQDDKEAVKWYRLAAEQGRARAQCNLGIMYANGRGVVQDFKEAVKWYRLAAEQGDADAQFNLGIMYGNGRGVAQDDKKAVKWYRLAAEQGNVAAQRKLGVNV